MRTSIEIPDPIFKAAKKHCFERGLTLRELVTNGLRRELEASASNPETRDVDQPGLPVLPTGARKPYTLTGEDIDRILLAEEIGGYGPTR